MITCFTSAGYIRFARSLIRFCGMKRGDALTLTNLCARANFNAFRTAAPSDRTGEIKGISLDLWDSTTPYHTEVQLYKAIRALSDNMAGGCDTSELLEAASHLNALTNDLCDRFWASYALDIEDERTVYGLCESTLEPSAEPSVCLLDDWNALNGGAV